jgi:hypothetical protein
MKRKLTLGLLLILIVVAALAAVSGNASIALAKADTTIDKWVVASGGGLATGGNITINDTLGQPIIGPSDSSSSGLRAGYWYLVFRSTSGTIIYYLPIIGK